MQWSRAKDGVQSREASPDRRFEPAFGFRLKLRREVLHLSREMQHTIELLRWKVFFAVNAELQAIVFEAREFHPAKSQADAAVPLRADSDARHGGQSFE